VGKHQVKSRNLKNLKTFGRNLKAVRTEKNLTQEQLADLAGVSENTVVVLESGTLNTTIATCFELAKALQVPVKRLFDF
jgi:DNA-binding XRE family transcriptional regulator